MNSKNLPLDRIGCALTASNRLVNSALVRALGDSYVPSASLPATDTIVILQGVATAAFPLRGKAHLTNGARLLYVLSRRRAGMKACFTAKQGQYLAFIYYYTKLNDRPPAEADMQRYFRVTPPTVHQMVLALEGRGLIKRTPGQARSIRLMIRPEDLPALD